VHELDYITSTIVYVYTSKVIFYWKILE